MKTHARLTTLWLHTWQALPLEGSSQARIRAWIPVLLNHNCGCTFELNQLAQKLSANIPGVEASAVSKSYSNFIKEGWLECVEVSFGLPLPGWRG